MKNTFLTICLLAAMSLCAQTQRYVGGDISLLPEYEANSSGYRDQNGNKIANLLNWLVDECGWNTFRVRIFVNPVDTKKEGVVQDLAYVKPLAKRIKDKGAFLMLDFHYSDTWVDATHIQAPAGWQGLNDSLMADTLGKYTAYVLDELIAYGATPDLVQVGNEIMYGLCGIKVHPYYNATDNWTGYANLLKAGCAAVREKCPNAKIIIHTDRPTNSGYNYWYYNKLAEMGVDYDVIGLSYYPFWHGYLTAAQVAGKTDKNNLAATLTYLATYFPTKEVQIVETAYNFQNWPTAGVNYDTRDVWPCSKAGQYNFIRDLVAEAKLHSNLSGISYWFPEEAGNGDYVNWTTKSRLIISSWLNRGLWDENSTTTGHALNTTGSQKLNVPHELGTYLPIPTALPATSVDPSAAKSLEDGRLVITRSGLRYAPDGRLLR